MVRGRSPRIVVSVVAVLVAATVGLAAEAAQLDPGVRDRVVPAVVQIAILVDVTENGGPEPQYLPTGSGTVVSPDGLVLTNWHVVDMGAHRAQLDAWEAQAAEDGEPLAFVLDEDRVLILGTDGASAPAPMYTAEVVAEDHALDLAVLGITGDEYGARLSGTDALPFVPVGDSSSVRQGDPLDLFGYPMIGGDALTYTDGVVSGFEFEAGIDGPAWITTNATMSGGSSGGTALDRTGQLIGVPTQGTELDCRPGDTNQDGTIDAEDVGCIPVGGSIGQLRPTALALPILASAGFAPGTVDPEVPAVAAAPTAAPPVATVDAAPAEPAAATSYIYAEDWCRTGPIYPPGTMIVLPRGVTARSLPIASVAGTGSALAYAYLPYRPYYPPAAPIPAGTEVEITGPYVENGACDLWPVRYRTSAGTEKEAYLDEWDLSPEFPNQIAPLPPEREALTSQMEEFCLSNEDYSLGMRLVLARDSPIYSYRRGYEFEHQEHIASGMRIDIVGPPVETGNCDMWPLGQSVIPASALADAGTGPLAEAEAVGQIVRGYIHESDLRPAGN